MPPLTKESWFGPRHLPGCGWSPRTWQGWLVSFVFIATILACAFLLPGVALKLGTEIVLIALLLAICLPTGTRPSSRIR